MMAMRTFFRICRTDDQGGFSLVELLFAVAMLSMLAISVTATMVGLRKSYTRQAVSADAQQAARIALDYMVREIRMAGLDPSGMAGAQVLEAGSHTFRFTRDMAGATGTVNGTIDEANMEQVTFFFDNATKELQEILYQGTGSQNTQPLLENISRFRFRYLDSTGTETTILSSVRMVEVSLTVEEPAGWAGEGEANMLEREYTTTAICRNLYL